MPIAELHLEMNKVAKAIAPTSPTLVIWRSSIPERLRRLLAWATPYILGFLTLLLTMYLVFQSSELNKADTAIREYQEWLDRHSSEKLYSAWKMYHYEQVLNVKTPPLAQLDAYQKLVEEAKQAFQKGVAVQNSLGEAAIIRYLPAFLESPAWGPIGKFVQRLNSASVHKSESFPEDKLEPLRPPEDPCQTEVVQSADLKAKAHAATKQSTMTISDYNKNFSCFLRQQQILESIFTYPNSGTTYLAYAPRSTCW